MSHLTPTYASYGWSIGTNVLLIHEYSGFSVAQGCPCGVLLVRFSKEKICFGVKNERWVIALEDCLVALEAVEVGSPEACLSQWNLQIMPVFLSDHKFCCIQSQTAVQAFKFTQSNILIIKSHETAL